MELFKLMVILALLIASPYLGCAIEWAIGKKKTSYRAALKNGFGLRHGIIGLIIIIIIITILRWLEIVPSSFP
ncbi:hypothetical protein MASR2M41_02650 [Flammeovirgaceae bacterium]